MKRILLFALFVFALTASQSFAATYTRVVTNCADDAAITGSLRWALTGLSASTDIIFDISTKEAGYATGEAYPGLVTNEAGSNTWFRIVVNSSLPSTNAQGIYIRGLTQTREASNALGPEIEIRGKGGYDGFTVNVGACTIEGLVINGFSGATAIVLANNSSSILGNYIGTSASGEAAIPNSRGILSLGGMYNKIGNGTVSGRNIISGNSWAGMQFTNSGFTHNTISGNYIGTNASGEAKLGNDYGIRLENYANNNKIGGGGGTLEGNVISGNNCGVLITGTGTDSNEVLGNYIGTDKTGKIDLGNTLAGINITSGKYNKIGNGTAGGRNIISGNNQRGIYIQSSANSNEVLGNYIGTDVSGESNVGNLNSGVHISGSSFNKIGNGTPAGRNIISGNTTGLEIQSLSQYNRVCGNYIGVTASGEAAIGNTGSGVYLNLAPKFNIIGGTTTYEGNIISGNTSSGVYITDSGTDSNEVLGNYIGTNVSGLVAIPNGARGVYIASQAQYNKIGNGTDGGKNVISGNIDLGIQISDSGTNSNEVLGNRIGTTASGERKLANDVGVGIYGGAQYNIVGGTTTGERNIISGNNVGVEIGQSNTNSNKVLGNYIGTTVSGEGKLANDNGVDIYGGAQYNIVGGTTTGERNIISGNNNGVRIGGSNTNSNKVLGNYIGTTASGEGKLANQTGVDINGGAQYNVVGGPATGERNIISGNNNGVYIGGSNANSNEVLGNYIGVGSDGLTPIGNYNYGIFISNGGSSNKIYKNIIANNGSASYPAGISIFGASTLKNRITQNSTFSNYGNGILLLSGGNGGIPSPVTLIGYSPPTGLLQVTGTATPNAVVEVFKAQGNQGKTYLGYVTANGAGVINGSLTYPGLVSGEVLIATATDPFNNTSEFGGTKEVILTAYQPDNMIGTLETGMDYKTEGLFENTPVEQVKNLLVSTAETAVFYYKVKNAGNYNDTIKMTAEAAGISFEVKYYDAKTGGNDITSQLLTGEGYLWNLASGESREGRLTVKLTDLTVTQTVTLTADISDISSNDATKKDVVRFIATFVPIAAPQPTGHGTQEFTDAQLGIPGMHITIPAGATTVDVTVSVTQVTQAQSPGNPPAGFNFGGKILNITSTPVNTFAIPVTVTIPIDGPLADPRVYYWNGTAWSRDGIVIVSYTNTSLTFTTTHFTIFTAMGALPSNLVRFGPNPYNPNNGSGNFWYWLDASKDTSIYLIDLGGTIVWKNSYSSGINGARLGENNISYDGKTSWGDVLGNGVYLYKIVQDSKSIGGGKIAVIK